MRDPPPSEWRVVRPKPGRTVCRSRHVVSTVRLVIRTDLSEGVPPQIPARSVAEMRHKGVDARLHDRRADRVLYVIPVIHIGVYTVDFDLFHPPPSEAGAEVVGNIGQAR